MKKLISILLCLALLSGLYVSSAPTPLGIGSISYMGQTAYKVSDTQYRLYLSASQQGSAEDLKITSTHEDDKISVVYTPSDAMENFSDGSDARRYATITLTRGEETLSVRLQRNFGKTSLHQR